jgi:hypothetical protein
MEAPIIIIPYTYPRPVNMSFTFADTAGGISYIYLSGLVNNYIYSTDVPYKFTATGQGILV